jgi:hypothetical protein
MARLVNGSKRVLIGTAFVAVMTGAGGLLGVLAGIVLALLARTVLQISTGTGEFIAACGLALGLAALSLSLYMTTHLTTRVATRAITPARVNSPTASAAESGEFAQIA